MAWLRDDDMLDEHEKFLALSDAAYRLWRRARSWQARQNEGLGLDGRIPKKIVRSLANNQPGWEDLVLELSTPLIEGKAPLWESAGDCWQIHDYLVYNRGAEQLRRERESNRDRQVRFKQRTRQEKQGEFEDGPEEVPDDGGRSGDGGNGVINGVSNGPGNSVSNAPTRTRTRTTHPVPGTHTPDPSPPAPHPPPPSPTPPASQRGGAKRRGAPPPDTADDVVIWIAVVGKAPAMANAYGAPLRYVQNVDAPELGEHRWRRKGDAYEYGVRQGEVDALLEAFPAVNALQKLRGLREWSRNKDPKARYTYAGMSNFLRKRFDVEQCEAAKGQRQAVRQPPPVGARDPGRNRAVGDLGEEWKT